MPAATIAADLSTPYTRLRNRALELQRAADALLAELEQTQSAADPAVSPVRISLRPIPMEVAIEVAALFNLRIDALLGPERHRVLVDARHMAFWFSYHLSGCSLKRTGMNLGGFDHVTIGNGIRKVRALWETNREFRVRHNAVEKALCSALRMRVGRNNVEGFPTTNFEPA